MQVSMMMVRALWGAVERAGGSRERFLELAGLEASALDNMEARISRDHYLRTLDAALTLSSDPALGLHLGEHANLVMFDALGPLTNQAANLREAIQIAQRYSRLVTDSGAIELVEVEQRAAIRLLHLDGTLTALRARCEFGFAGFTGLLRSFAGPDARPSALHFHYPAPAYAAEYDRVFGAPVRFEQAHTELVFPREWLDCQALYRNEALRALLESRAELLLGRLQRDQDLSERVIKLLASHEPRTMPMMNDVAQELGISIRTFRRRLAREGVSYGALVEGRLIEIAKRTLERPAMSIRDAASLLGFSSAAGFHKAFKRWTGMTPKRYQATF